MKGLGIFTKPHGMLKKCMLLWREAHFEVESVKN